MALAISAFSDIKLIPGMTSKDADQDGVTYLYPYPKLLERANGVRKGAYLYGKRFDFDAGSYHGYNYWRRALPTLVGRIVENIRKSDPFYELVDFPDNEGVIGPRTSAKLARDFAKWKVQARVVPRLGGVDDFYEKYCMWLRAFELASHHGAVSFH